MATSTTHSHLATTYKPWPCLKVEHLNIDPGQQNHAKAKLLRLGASKPNQKA
jgi:hypothetical protein